ncbi:BRO family protein [Priestia flexa]|uniref:BRO family protein n=1 Tax=Priestia flexa TaxID=86664 RepID=UPI0019595FDB|nr:BRO family protein [Priestia flexa]
MSNQLQAFNHEAFGEVRTIMKDNEVWFVAKDVAEVLEYTDAEALTRNVDEDEKQNLQLVGFNRGAIVINEAGLYSVIITSRKTEAKAFKRWVTHEVLPSIRKNGGYIANQEVLTPEQIVANALVVAQNIINDKQRQLEEANQTIAIQTPKADYFDELVERNLLVTIRDTAKELKIKERKFVQWLLANKYVYRNNKKQLRPHSQYVPDLFEMKEFVNPNGFTGFKCLFHRKDVKLFDCC